MHETKTNWFWQFFIYKYIYIYIYINKLRHNKQFSMHLFYLGLREYQKVGVRNNRSEQCLSLLNVIFIIYINSRIINEVSSDIISLNPCVFVKIWTLSNKCNLSNEEAFGSLKQPKKTIVLISIGIRDNNIKGGNNG